MFSLFHTLSLRYLWRHQIRAGLVVMSIALGVAAWVATKALYGTVTHALHEAAVPLRGDADLSVTNSAARFVDASLGPALELKVAGIDRVEPLILENITARFPPAPAASGADRKKPRRSDAILIGLQIPQEEEARRDRLEQRDIELLEIEDDVVLLRLAAASQVADAIQPAILRPFTRLLGPTPVLVGEQLDRDFLKGKKRFVIEAGGQSLPVIVVGRVRATGAFASLGGQAVITAWQPAARLLGKPGMVHRLDIKLAPQADADEVLREARLLVGSQGKVQTTEDQDKRLRHVLKAFEIGYWLGGIGALVVGLFLVYNAMSVSVTERRHDIGILRSVGATRTQVRALFLAEAQVLGVVGALIGIPLGMLIAHVMLGPIQELVSGIFLTPLQRNALELSPGALLTAGLGGVLTADAAALIPASRAASEEPADAVRRAPPAAGVAYRLLQIGGSLTLGLLGVFLIAVKPYLTAELVVQTCLVLTAAGLGLAVGGYWLFPSGPADDSDGPSWRRVVSLVYGALFVVVGLAGLVMRGGLAAEKGSYAAVVLILLAALLLTPLLAAVLTRLLQRATRRILPIESRLAVDNLVRSPGRTGLVIAALAAGVSLTVLTAGLIRSNQVAFSEWIDSSVKYDLYLRSADIASTSGQMRALSPKMAEELLDSKLLPPGTRLVGQAYRYPEWDAGNRRSSAGAGDADSTLIFMTLIDAREHYLANKARSGAGADAALNLWRRLADEPGAVIISENFALLHGVKVGETIQLEGSKDARGNKEPIRLRVIGTIVDYNWIRGSIWVDRPSNRDTLSADEVNAWEVYFPPDYQDHAPPSLDGAEKSPFNEKDGRKWTGSASDWRDHLVKSPLGAKHRLLGLTRSEVRDSYLRAVRSIYGLAYTQELVVGVVVVLGVVAALLISVLGRQRELGLLRAVGATRMQVLHTVLAEAVLIGAVGTVLGILVGLPLEWYWVRVILFEEAGFLFPVLIPWLEVGVIVAVSILSATLAGLAPALHAVRLNIAEAIAYE